MEKLFILLLLFGYTACGYETNKDQNYSEKHTPQKNVKTTEEVKSLPLDFKVNLEKAKSIARREIKKFDTDDSMRPKPDVSSSFNLEHGTVAGIVHVDQSNVRRKLIIVFFDDLKNPGHNAYVVLEKEGNKYVPFERAMSIDSKTNIIAEIRKNKALFDDD